MESDRSSHNKAQGVFPTFSSSNLVEKVAESIFLWNSAQFKFHRKGK